MNKNVNKRAIGFLYEAKVADYLSKNAYEIVERNFYTKS